MSETIFVVGLGFLILAAIQSVWRPDDTATTSVIAGVGVIQLVALFYRSPLENIAWTVSNAQQAKLAITAYFMGVALLTDQIALARPTEQHLQTLSELTDRTLERLQYYSRTAIAESRKRPPRRGSPNPHNLHTNRHAAETSSGSIRAQHTDRDSLSNKQSTLDEEHG